MPTPAAVKAIFLEAAAIDDPVAREALLAERCGDDAALRGRVVALLAANELAVANEGTMTYGNRAAIADSDSSATADFPGVNDRVGAILGGKYKLIEEIGEGGMGSVFMAQQTEPVKRAVAVKVIKAGMDTKAVLARFEAERQALAMMDHPNIAKVLDAGTTDSGRPYFVMELVKGVPITKFCDERKLTPRQRLELFVPVCQAIQHAHQKGIIHRDIKPSNVMVALYDDRPVPNVIDFGVAKAAGSTLTDKTLMTGFGAVVGTPEYMSPEQANMNQLDIDTRSDVYSLGVLLYELLTGSTPVDRKSLGKAALLEVLRIVREVEAPRPSAKLSTIDTLPSVAANRGTEPAKLSKLMKGELDWVVLKALEKDRTRRYDTANGLARDIQRYLADEIVEARPPSAGYRLKKFVQRNRGQVIAASLLLCALLAGIAGTTLGLIEAKKQERLAVAAADEERNAKDREAQRAEGERLAKLDAQEKEKLAVTAADKERAARLEEQRQRKFAEAISGFVRDDFLALTSVEGQDRFGGAGKEALSKDTTLRELLDRAAAKLRARKDLDPRTEAELCWIVGVNYRGAGEAEKAIGFLERAVRLRGDLLGRDHADTLKAMNSLAVAYDAAGKFDLALRLREEELKLQKAKFGPGHPETLISMSNLARAYRVAGKLDLALPLWEETLKLMKAHPGSHSTELMSHVAAIHQNAGEFDLALPLREEALKLNRAKLGPEHRDTLMSLNNLAEAYRNAGEFDLALSLHEETQKHFKSKFGPEHPDTLMSLNNLACAYQDAGKWSLALPLFDEALKLNRAKLGPEHPGTLLSMSNLAESYLGAGKLELALPLHKEALRLRKAKLGPDHPDTLQSMSNLAKAYLHAGKLDLALPLCEESLRLRKAKLGPDHPHTLESMTNLAKAYEDAGKFDLALPLYEETLRLRKAKRGPDHPQTLNTMGYLGKAYQAAGKLDVALPLFEETLKLAKAKLGPEHPSTLTSMGNLAVAYRAAGRGDLALPLFEETLKLLKAKCGPDHLNTLVSMDNLATAYRDAGKLDVAVPLVEETLRLMKAKLGPDHPTTLITMQNLAAAHDAVKQFDKAELVYQERLRLEKEKTGGDSPAYAGVLAHFGLSLLQQKKWTAAETVLRECLTIRERTQPDVWSTFNVKSALGAALLGQKKYADAEPLLLKGYEGMKAREKTIPPEGSTRIPEALDRLIELSSVTNKPDDVKKWRAERAKYPTPKEAAPMPKPMEKK